MAGRPRRTTILEPGIDLPISTPDEIRGLSMPFLALTDRFSHNWEEGIKWMVSLRLLANSMECPVCESAMSIIRKHVERTYRRQDGDRSPHADQFMYRCADCRNDVKRYVTLSIRHKSFFSKSNLGLEKIMCLIYLWAHYPINPRRTIIRELGITTQKTITDWFNFLRDVCQMWALDESNPRLIGGEGVIVEIDESHLYGAKYNRGKALRRKHQWVFGMVQRGTKQVVLVPVDKRDAATLLPIIERWVRPGSIIISDCWKAYAGIKDMPMQYQHFQINHSRHFVDPARPWIHTQSIEGTWSALKRGMFHLRGTSPQLFDSYMFEFMFRRALNKDADPFGNILYWIGHYYPFF